MAGVSEGDDDDEDEEDDDERTGAAAVAAPNAKDAPKSFSKSVVGVESAMFARDLLHSDRTKDTLSVQPRETRCTWKEKETNEKGD